LETGTLLEELNMASTYTTNFGIEEMGSGDQSGAWGVTTNFNLDILDRIAAYKSVTISSTSHTLTVRETSPDSGTSNVQDGMFRVIKFVDGGDIGGNCTVTVAPNTTTAWFIFENALSASRTIDISQGSGSNVTIQNGKNVVVYCDGGGGTAAVANALGDLQIGTLEVTGAGAIDGNATVGGTLGVTGNTTLSGTLGVSAATTLSTTLGVTSLITGSAGASLDKEDSGTTTVLYPLDVKRTSSGTPAAGIGVGMQFITETAGGNNETGGAIESLTTDVSSTAEDFDMVFKTMLAGATAAEKLRIKSSGKVAFANSAYASVQVSGSASGSTILDFDTYQNFFLTAGGNVTLANPTTESIGQSGVIVFAQDGTGSRTLSLGTQYYAPSGTLTISTAASAVDIIPYFVWAADKIALGTPQLALANVT
tara:strand:- start:884 stop:2155 length:1272 start_codon:yes stop_codon:yes gene_type:complete